MRQQVTPQWKLALAVFSLLLTVLIWQQGLRDSFERPSVTPKLSLNQHEIALLASPALPNSLESILVGSDSEGSLKQILLDIPQSSLEDRDRLLLALTQQLSEKENALSAATFQGREFQLIQKKLLESLGSSQSSQLNLKSVESLKSDPLLYRLSCLAIGGSKQVCIDKGVSQVMALRLVVSQLLPLLSTLLGFGICIRQCWVLFRQKSTPWPTLTLLPFSLIDMVLLVAGGFVVLGEVISPLIAIPISKVLTGSISSPIKESLNVFIGYCAMTVPPLIIFRQQSKIFRDIDTPVGGWMQWSLRPFKKGILDAIRGWLMVMPFVLGISWLVSLIMGDPGGSNPLLEMVLKSNNYWALAVLFITTVVLAPLFEEFVFRGVFLPVLAKVQGNGWGIFTSALVFALAHLSVGELPPLLVLGIGLGVLRLSSGRLFPCVIMHSLWNGITFVNLLILGG